MSVNVKECGRMIFVQQDASGGRPVSKSDHSWCHYGGLVVNWLCFCNIISMLKPALINIFDDKMEAVTFSVLWLIVWLYSRTARFNYVPGLCSLTASKLKKTLFRVGGDQKRDKNKDAVFVILLCVSWI